MEYSIYREPGWWKPAMLPDATSPLSGMLNGFGLLGVPGDCKRRVIVISG